MRRVSWNDNSLREKPYRTSVSDHTIMVPALLGNPVPLQSRPWQIVMMTRS